MNEHDILRQVKDYLGYLMECGVEGLRLGKPQARPWNGDSDNACVPTPVRSFRPETLAEVRTDLGDCRRCPLSRVRTNIVFGEGNPDAEIVFVGEGPGSEEDRTGRPFVGRAGQLLTRIIENGMKIQRRSVYICNIVKCRPPGNRTPRDEEVGSCFPFLERQINAIRPRVIVTLGQPAACALLGVQKPMHALRGEWHSFRGVPLMPTFHPSYVLRRYTREIRALVHKDTQEVLRFLRQSTQSQE